MTLLEDEHRGLVAADGGRWPAMAATPGPFGPAVMTTTRQIRRERRQVDRHDPASVPARLARR
jgi:hypothetical protein